MELPENQSSWIKIANGIAGSGLSDFIQDSNGDFSVSFKDTPL